MKALIYAGGLGTRLHPMTQRTPKCMISLGGKPVLEHIINHLNKHGITNIVVKVHWLYPQIMEYFSDKVIYFFENELRDQSVCEQKLRPWLGDKYVVVNGDTLSDVDLNDMAEKVTPDSELMYWDNEKDCFAGYKVVFGTPGKTEHYTDDTKFWLDMGTPEQLEKARELYDRD